MYFLLSGPGIAVCILGPEGSLGNKDSSASDGCGLAAATLAAGFAVVVTVRRVVECRPFKREKVRALAVFLISDAISAMLWRIRRSTRSRLDGCEFTRRLL